MRSLLGSLAALLVGVVSTLPAKAEPDPAPPGVETIVVSATRVNERLRNIPASVSIVAGDDIHKARPTIGLEEPLRQVPGVFIQNSGNYAQDLRLQIRGFGTRAAFGIREITLLVDGLPETLPDGQSQVDTIELGSLQRIEVLRGAGAALYGNAAGGVIHMITQEPPENPGGRLHVVAGSYGLFKITNQIGARSGNLGAIATASYLRTNGYRAHSAARVTTVLSRFLWEGTGGTKIKFLLDGVYAPRADDPGGLTKEQVKEDRRQARDRNVLLDAGEAVDQIRLGMVLDRDSGPGRLNAYAYALYRDFDAHLPIVPAAGDGIVQFDRLSPGGGARYTYDRPILGWAQTFSVGGDLQYQRDDRQRFANEEGQKGAMGLDQLEQVTGIGLYLHETIPITSTIELSAALRYDNVHYQVDVRTPPDSDASGSRSLGAWSPGGGITYNPTDTLSLFTNVTTAFQAPTTTELVNPRGPGFNPDIEPQKARNVEVGLRFRPRDLEVDLSLYQIALEDELIPFETPSGRVAFRNAGRSRRSGIELRWRSKINDRWTWTGSGTALHARYVSYETEDGDFAGNDEPGIPPWFVYQQIAYTHANGIHAALEGYVVGNYYVDDANTAKTPGYGLINLRAGWDGSVGGWDLSPFVGLRNLTNAHYDGTVRLNAFGGRYYEPAPGFNLYGGIEIRWSNE